MRSQLQKRISVYFYAVVVFIVGLLPQSVFAECEQSSNITLEVAIGSQTMTDGLTQYISAMYSFVVGAIGTVSVVVIMFAGVKWAAAAGNQTMIGDAKERIKGALIGLAIALGSYLILFNINPALTVFPVICPEKIEVPITTEGGTDGWALCSTTAYCNENINYCDNGGCACEKISADGSTQDVCLTTGRNTVPEGGLCQNDNNCKEPHTCYGADKSSPGTCQTGNEGAACSGDADCTDGLVCETDTEQCLEATTRDDGQYCTDDGQCQSNLCATSVNKCAGGEAGDACYGDSDYCLAAYACTGSTCSAKTAGDSCDDDDLSSCPPGLYCVGSDNAVGSSCQNGAIDSFCDGSSQCTGGMNCLDNRCSAGIEGHSCESNDDCAGTLECDFNITDANRCTL